MTTEKEPINDSDPYEIRAAILREQVSLIRRLYKEWEADPNNPEILKRYDDALETHRSFVDPNEARRKEGLFIFRLLGITNKEAINQINSVVGNLPTDEK